MKVAQRWQSLIVVFAVVFGLISLLFLFGRPDASEAAPLAQEAGVILEKQASVSTATWDDTIEYTLEFRIPSGTVMTSTVVRDCLPNNSSSPPEPYYIFQTGSTTGPLPGNANTPAIDPVTPVAQSGNCWQWNLPDITNDSSGTYVYVIEYAAQVRFLGSEVGEVGINAATLSWYGATSLSDNVSVTTVGPDIDNSFTVGGPGGQLAPTGTSEIADLRAGDTVTLTLSFTNIAGVNARTAYSTVVYSLIPEWVTNLEFIHDTPEGAVAAVGSDTQRSTMVRWHAPGTETGVGEVQALGEIMPGDAFVYTVRGQVAADVTPNLEFPVDGFGRELSGNDLRSKLRVLPDQPDTAVFYPAFDYPSLDLASSVTPLSLVIEDAAPEGFVAAYEVVTYTVVFTQPAGTTLHLPLDVAITLEDGLVFGGVESAPLTGFSGPVTSTVGNTTQVAWSLTDPVASDVDVAYTFVFTGTVSPTYFIGRDAGGQVTRLVGLTVEAGLQHNPADPYVIWNTPSAEVTLLYARPYFESVRKCLWRDGACTATSSSGSVVIEGGEELVFRIENTRNGGSSYTGNNVDATTDAYNVVVWDLLPPGFTLVDAWPDTYTTADIGGQTAITWTPWALVEKGYYIPGVVPPTPSLEASYFVITVTAPAHVVGQEIQVNTATVNYEDESGTQYVDSSSLRMRLPVVTSKAVSAPAGTTVRVGDVFTYTVVDEIASGGILYWARHRDELPAGVWYVPDSYTLTGGGAVPVSGPYTDTTTTQERMYWGMDTLVDPGTLTHTWQTRYTGVNASGTVLYNTWPVDMRVHRGFTNRAWLEWAPSDAPAPDYPVGPTTTGYPLTVGASRAINLDQPLLADPDDPASFVKTLYATPDGTPTVYPGDIITYELTLRNTGYAPAYDTVLNDTLPAGLSFVSYEAWLSDSSDASFTPSFSQAPAPGDTALQWVVDEIPPKPPSGGHGLLTLRYAVHVDPEAVPGTVLTNSVGIEDFSSLPGDDPYERHYGSWYTDIVRSAEPVTVTPPIVTLALAKTGPAAVMQGETFTYTLTYTKTGTGAQTGYLTDTLPAGLVYVGYTADPAVTQVAGAPEPAWDLGLLPDGASGRVVVTVTVPLAMPFGTLLTNEAAFSAKYATPVNATAQTLVNGVALSIEKIASALQVLPGATVVYTLTYENAGNTAATGALITETYPADVTFVSANPAPTSGTAVWDLGDLGAGQGGTIVITVTVSGMAVDGTQVVNAVALGADNHPAVTDTATVEVVIDRVSLTKAGPAVVNAGELLTYTLTYTATGLHGGVDAVLTEAYPDHVTYDSATPAPDAGTNNVWHLGDLAPGTTGTIQVVLRVDRLLSNGTLITNTASIETANAPSATATASTLVRSGPVLEITKSGHRSTVRPEDVLVYTIAYANTGTWPATGVVLTDTYDVDTTFVAADPVPTSGNNVWDLGTLPVGSGTIVITTTVNASTEENSTVVNRVVIDSVETEPVEASATTWVRSGTVYLPVVFRTYRQLADLRVTAVVVAPASPAVSETVIISVTVVNQGQAPASNFWVDLYVDPVRAPEPGEIWHDISPIGKAWLIRDTLLPGEQLVVTTEQPDDPLNPDDRYSNWPGYFIAAGTHTLYGQVDPYPAETGSVVELDETNNIFGPVTVSVAGTTLNGLRVLEVPLPPVEPLSPRP